MLYIYVDYAEVSPLSGFLVLKGNGGFVATVQVRFCNLLKAKPKPTHLQPS